MKLAEALSKRKDLQQRIAQLRERLVANAKVQDGDTPAEDPEALLDELKRDTAELESYIGRINLTNSAVKLGDITITEVIAKRDTMALRISILRDFVAQAAGKVDRYTKTEIRILSTVDVAEKRKELDSLCAELRELDVSLQGANWTTDLI